MLDEQSSQEQDCLAEGGQKAAPGEAGQPARPGGGSPAPQAPDDLRADATMFKDPRRQLPRTVRPHHGQLTAALDAMIAEMQTARSKTAVSQAFSASPEELGAAAVAVAQRAKRQR